MKKKIFGIFVCMLVIVSAIPAVESFEKSKINSTMSSTPLINMAANSTEKQKLFASDGVTGDMFDDSVSRDGEPSAGGVLMASDYASNGIGTASDPYVNCLYNAFNSMNLTSMGEIYFSKAFYRETHGITNDVNIGKPRHLALRGAGFWDSVILLGPNMNEPLITIKNHTSLYMQGIEVDGRKAQNPSYTGPMIYLHSSYDVAIHDCCLEDSHGSGIQIGSIDGSSFAWSTDIINCPVEYFDGNAITITSSKNCIIDSVTLALNHGYNIDMTGVGSSYPIATVTNSALACSYQDSIRLGTYASIIITNCILSDDSKAYKAVLFDCPSLTLRNIIISNNVFQAKYGLYFNSAKINNKVTIEGNDFSSCTYACNFPIKVHRGLVVNNLELNPIGKYSNPFYYYGSGLYYIEPNSGQSSPLKNKMYIQEVAPARIISTGGTNVSIKIYDGRGNLISDFGSTCDVRLAVGQVINFGNFVTTPTVSVYFE
jgi:hypothetical protein